MMEQLFAVKTQTAYWYEQMAGIVRMNSLHYAELLMQFSKEEAAHAKLLLGQMSTNQLKGPSLSVCLVLPVEDDEEPALSCVQQLLGMEKNIEKFLIDNGDKSPDFLPFPLLSAVSKTHEETLLLMARRLETATVTSRAESCSWHCLNCGYISGPALEAPDECPLCRCEAVFSEQHQPEL